MSPRDGLIIVNTGDGKGKTTAALGLMMRARGWGMGGIVIQFIKGCWKYGELETARKLGFELRPMGRGFTWRKDVSVEEHKAAIAEAWALAKTCIFSGEYAIVVLDEIHNAMSVKSFPTDDVLPLKEVLDVMKRKPRDLHLVLTGRSARQEIIEAADLVTEMRMIKHPYNDGRNAQKGIEY